MRLWRDDAGASAVEFAMLIAPFMLLLFGVIEVSRALWTRQAAQDVAIAAARCVGVLQAECTSNGAFDVDKTRTYLRDAAAGRAIFLEDAETSIVIGVECDGLPSAVETQLRVRFDSVFPFDSIVDFRARACFADWSTI